jgi:hypothetical protein
MTGTLLWILAILLIIAGVVALLRRRIILGIVLIVVGLFLGPLLGLISG